MTTTQLLRESYRRRYIASQRPLPRLIYFIHLLFAKENVGSDMEVPRPPPDASGTKQISDNHESKPREQKKSLDRRISFNPGTADTDSALGGATEAAGN